MVLMETPVCEFGKDAFDFSLPDVANNTWNLDAIKGDNGLLVMFICNHCPYVQAIIARLVTDCRELLKHNVGCVAIMANDYRQYPEDSPENMEKFSQQFDFPFPYLVDHTQEVAKQYNAICTPDFFGYNKDLKLQYRGRFDSAGAQAAELDTEKNLLPAMLEIAKTGVGPHQQFPSVGCSIKWN